jgi:hypothetical protein
MEEIRTVTTLEAKRTEIRNAIAEYERRLTQARADLAHVTACIRLFDTSDVTPSTLLASPYDLDCIMYIQDRAGLSRVAVSSFCRAL